MIGNAPEYSTTENYRRFATREARGRSPLYEQLAGGVADDPELVAFLADLQQEKRQPNLLLAAVRYLAGVQRAYDAFRAVVLDRRDEVAATILARRTQTNEPARCATLLPALASLRQPLALLEVGASAGLCLLPDRYSYDYGTCRIDGHPGAPVLTCRCTGPVPIPRQPVEVAWHDDQSSRSLWSRTGITCGLPPRRFPLLGADCRRAHRPPGLIRQVSLSSCGAVIGGGVRCFQHALTVHGRDRSRSLMAAAIKPESDPADPTCRGYFQPVASVEVRSQR